MREIAVHLLLEGRVLLRRGIGLLQFEDERHQRLGDEASAIDAEMAASRRDRCGRNSAAGSSYAARNSSARALRGIRLAHRAHESPDSRGILDARPLSTPDDTSTAGARVIASACPTLPGSRPPESMKGSPDQALSAGSSRTAGPARRGGWPLSGRGHRTAASRRRPGRPRPPARSAAVSTGSAFMTGSPNRARSAVTRSGVSWP